MKFVILFAIVVAIALTSPRASFAATDPADVKNNVPLVLYQSPFRAYRPLGEDKPIPWKAANEEVARIGGWRAYAKEAQDTAGSIDPAAPNVPAAAVKPARTTAAPIGPPASEPNAKPTSGPDGHGQHK